MKLIRKAGVTSEIWQIWIANSASSVGAGLTALVHNSAGLTAYYHRDTDTTATAITLVDMTVGTFTSSGFKKVDDTNMPGVYQFCPPNAALAAGAKSCIFLLKGAADMATLVIEVELVAVDLDDTVRFGLTALPNAAAEAAGGLYTRGSGAGQINQPANGQIDVNVEKWNATNVPAEHTAGYPIVTVKDGTGTGEIDTTSGGVLVSALAANVITAASIAADVSGEIADAVWDEPIAAHIAAGSTAEALATAALAPTAATIADSVWDEATAGHVGAGTTGKALTDANNGTPPTVGAIADQVWDEAIAGHLGAGSTGAALNAAGSAGDPWTTPLPGAYGAGTAGFIIGTNLDAPISDVPADVLTAAAGNPINSNVKEVNDVVVTGVGTIGNPWGPA